MNKIITIWLIFGLLLATYLFRPKDIIVESLTETTQKTENLCINCQTHEVVLKPYKLTYYYTGDPYGSGTCTASGKCIKHFKTNDKGWYTYQGKVVIATATNSYIKKSKYGFRENITYRNLYDEIEITINNKKYQAIVMDVCGYCHKEERIDIFTNGSKVGGIGYAK